ncbi:serine/threonine-protein kinase [Parahaliea aestuarii]|uniref:Protein kinase n=1 Tax=Parahaliea aestuarii TaxID=1852021 RepID=A0A5C8ZQC6_9GAMM|nr:serine/threonine-protein kinase [Parahaliea aestuarii]TXS90545.1 protein kinase [Parahaliea aestuarii]
MADAFDDKTLPASGSASSQATTRHDNSAITRAEANIPPGDGEGGVCIGDVISGRYELTRLLGEGGMGRVFQATDLLYTREFEDRHAEVAIKFLGIRFAAHDVARMALQREARKCQQLSHPNVVRVLYFDLHEGLPYMIMEFMRGLPLDDFLRRHPRGLPLAKALPLIEGMCSGLDYIHRQGLVHSDFKPNNVFVSDDGVVKILDLGIARAREDSLEGVQSRAETRFDASQLGALTPSYASCEMFEGQSPDPRDDVYALACVCYEVLTGRHPFKRLPAPRARGEGRRAERPAGLGARRWRVLQRGLSFTRKDRLASAPLLYEALAGQRDRQRLWLVAGSVLAAAGVALWLGLRYLQGPDPDQVFLDSLTPANPAPLQVGEAARLQSWLEQGQVYLEIAQQEFAGGDLVSALHIMDGGADNAYRAFSSVLGRQDSAAARAGVMAMLDTYHDWARQAAAQGDREKALLITCHGLKIHSRHRALLAVAEAASEGMSEARIAQLNDC